jgi:hypothetical protein
MNKYQSHSIAMLLLAQSGWAALWHFTQVTEPETIAAGIERSEVDRDRFGHTKRTEFVSAIKTALAGRSAFIGANVDRTYTDVEHLRRTALGIPSEATITFRYGVAYPIGFDLRPGRVSVLETGDAMLITLDRPRLVASPGIRFLRSEVLDHGLFVDEQAETIAFQRRQLDNAVRRAGAIAADPAVTALCEQRLAAFLRAFLAKQPKAGPPPTIRFDYR